VIAPDPHALVFGPATDQRDQFTQLFETMQGPIYNYIYRLVGDTDDAMDLTQDTFVRAYKGLAELPTDSNLKAWVYRIARNMAIDTIRRRKTIAFYGLAEAFGTQGGGAGEDGRLKEGFASRRHGQALIDSDRRTTPADAVEMAEDREEVQSVLMKLLPQWREVLILAQYEQLSNDEIAAVLGCTRKTVKQLAFRARNEFRYQYARAYPHAVTTTVARKRVHPLRQDTAQAA